MCVAQVRYQSLPIFADLRHHPFRSHGQGDEGDEGQGHEEGGRARCGPCEEGHEEGDEGQEVGDYMRSLPGPGRARPACAARVASLFPSEEVETAGALGAASPGAPSAH